MKISGRWNDNVSWKFHVEDKARMRDVIDGDINTLSGNGLEKLAEIKTEPKLLIDSGEGNPLNYIFLVKLREEFVRVSKKYKLSFLHRRIESSVWDKILALYRQDPAYFERIGGCISALIVSILNENLDINGDYIYIFKALFEWWETNDKRERFKHHYAYVFKYFIKSYENDKNFRYISNDLLLWIKLNSSNWQHHEKFEPQNWYGNSRRGVINNLIHGRQS